jgi:hypothetical protein
MMLNKYIILVKKKQAAVFLLFILMIPFPVTASTITVTFEDLTMPTGFISPGLSSSILDGYKGFDWNNFGVIDTVSVGGIFTVSGYTNGIVSGSRVGFSDEGIGSTITADDGSEFDFNSAYLTGAWDSNVRTLVTGFKDGEILYQDIYYKTPKPIPKPSTITLLDRVFKGTLLELVGAWLVLTVGIWLWRRFKKRRFKRRSFKRWSFKRRSSKRRSFKRRKRKDFSISSLYPNHIR